jgi:hypothetical protein
MSNWNKEKEKEENWLLGCISKKVGHLFNWVNDNCSVEDGVVAGCSLNAPIEHADSSDSH